MSELTQLLTTAVQLLRESGRHFKSRQVAEARRLIETALHKLQEPHAQTKKAEQTTTPHPPEKT